MSMSLDQFMIWRFRNIEGVLDDIKSWNLNTCVFKNGSTITYDLKNNLVTIDEKNTGLSIEPITISIEECTKNKLINDFGFKERFINRHEFSR